MGTAFLRTRIGRKAKALGTRQGQALGKARQGLYPIAKAQRLGTKQGTRQG